MRLGLFAIVSLLGVFSAVSSASAQSEKFAGQWRTDWGPAEVFRDGSGFSGSYVAEDGNTDNNGTFVLTKNGKTWAGYWAEPNSNEKCDTKRFGTYYWGRLKLGSDFSESGFDMNWGYCDDPKPSRLWVFNIKTGNVQAEDTTTLYEASSIINRLKSSFWKGAVKSNAQGKASYCFLSAAKRDDEFTIQLYWNSSGFHVLIYSDAWSLVKGDEFQGRVKIGNRFDGLIEASIFDSESIDYKFGFNEKALRAFQRGTRISLEGPLGKKTFRLKGTRKAVDILRECARDYLKAGDDPSVALLSDEAEDVGNPSTDTTPPNPAAPKSLADELVARAALILTEIEDGTLVQAFELADAAAALGDRRGQWMAGRLALAGVGTAPDRSRGMALILSAAEAGLPEALTFMGLQYLQDGDDTSNATGTEYLERAAEQGHAPAQSALRFFKAEASR